LVTPKKISAPPIGLMIENRDGNARRNAEFAVVAKLLQSATPKICSMLAPH
jgi:hypothetical protein